MNDNNAFERFIADHLADDGSGAAQAERIAARIYDNTDDVRQRPRWLALIKEPPMRIESRVAVGSPTVRVAAILAATMLIALTLAAAGFAGQRLLASSAIVVDASGAGDYTTITEAVAAVVDGDEIVVMPGVYAESVRIDKDITLRGDGTPDEVVIEFSSDGLIDEITLGLPAGIALVDSDAVVRDLTVRNAVDGVGITVQGGSPLIEGVVVTGETGLVLEVGLVLEGGTDARVSAAHIDGGAMIAGDSVATIEGSLLCGNLFIQSDAIVRDNRVIQATPDGQECVEFVAGGPDDSIQIGDASPTISGNTIVGLAIGINVAGEGAAPLIEDNTLRDMPTAITANDGATPTVRSNEFIDNRVAISLPGSLEVEPAQALVEDNAISGGSNAILVTGGTSMIVGNTVEGASGRAVAIGPNAAPTLRDNVLCGNDENLFVADGATPDIDDSNEICPDGLTE